MKIRWIATLLGLAFVVTLAVIVGLRLSAEAMAVTVGVIAGVAASIPTSLIVVWLTTRHLNSAPAPRASEPRILYVNTAPPSPQPVWPAATPTQATPYLPTLTSPNGRPPSPRRFMGLDDPDPVPADTLPRATALSVTVIGGVE